MSGRLAIWTIVIAGILPAVGSWAGEGANEGAKMVSCGNGVRAAIVDCGKAKRLAREHRRTGDRMIWMYTCKSGERRGICVLDRKIVTFRV
jgi:hypothetical protein